MATCIAASTATKRKTEASVAEVPTLPVVDTSESESVRYEVCLQKFPRLVEAVRPVVVKFAVNALSKSLISEYNKCQAENPTAQEYDRASVLMSQITPKIKDSDAHFDAFVAILEELEITKLAHELKKAVDPTVKLPTTASTTREDSDSGSISGTESVDATGFKCPCGQCSIENYFRDRSKCPSLQETAFPFLNTRHLSTDERETLEHQLIGDTNGIKKEFKKLSDAVFKALKGTKTPISEIRSTVLSSGSSKPIQTSSHIDELKTITTIADLKFFLIRHEYISFFNYEILKAFIEDYDDCKECQVDLDSYLQEFKKFSRRNVFEVPAETLNPPSTLDNLLVVKVNDGMWFGAKRDTPDCPFTLNDIKSIQNKIADIIGHDRRFIHLVDVGKGCLQLAFAVLPCQEAPIFPLSTSQLSEMIRCGIIVLYQPNLPSLPTNIQDTDGQTHDIQSTVADDSETPPTIPSVDDSETPSIIPSAPVLSTVKPIQPVTRFLPSQFTDDDSRSMISADSGSTASSSEVLQEPRKWNMSTGLSLTMEELEGRIADKKRDLEEWKDVKADYQQWQREAEKRVRDLQSRLAQTTDEDDQRELERKIHDEEEMIKVWKERLQQCEERINKAESELLALTETKVKEQPQHQTLSRKKELPLRMEELERTIAEKKSDIEEWKDVKANYQQRQRKTEVRVRDLQSRLAQTTDEDDRRELEKKIHDEEEMIKWWKERVQRCEEWINKAEPDILALKETKDKGHSQHQTSIELPPTLETKVDTFTLEDDV